ETRRHRGLDPRAAGRGTPVRGKERRHQKIQGESTWVAITPWLTSPGPAYGRCPATPHGRSPNSSDQPEGCSTPVRAPQRWSVTSRSEDEGWLAEPSQP